MFAMKRYDPLAPDAGTSTSASSIASTTTNRRGGDHMEGNNSNSADRSRIRHRHHKDDSDGDDERNDRTRNRKRRSNRKHNNENDNADDDDNDNNDGTKGTTNDKENVIRTDKKRRRQRKGVDYTLDMDGLTVAHDEERRDNRTDNTPIVTGATCSAGSINSDVVTPPLPVLTKRPSRWGPSLTSTAAVATTTTSKNGDDGNRPGTDGMKYEDSSSSAPSSSDEESDNDDDNGRGDDDDNSSSSAPSSSSEEEEEEDEEKNTGRNTRKGTTKEQDHTRSNDSSSSRLKVIAPEQKPSLAGTEPSQYADEGMDDFEHITRNNTNNKEPTIIPQTPDQILQTAELTTALQISRLPLPTVAKLWNLAPFLTSNLAADGHTNFFPIQALVIPDVISGERHRGDQVRSRDVCVSAPTGSGKTLSFVLPILNSLGGRRVRRLRALVVLPGRDLAMQVHSVFQRYSKGSDLTIGLAIGQTDFKKEQRSLILGSQYVDDEDNEYDDKKQNNEGGDDGDGDDNDEPSAVSTSSKPRPNVNNNDNDDDDNNTVSKYRMSLDDNNDANTAMLQYTLDPMNSYKALRALCPPPRGIIDHKHNHNHNTDMGGHSAIDVLVCTPGRLMDHLDRTPGFTLQHLRFLVLDEADRLVSQRYQNWIKRVQFAAMEGPRSMNRRHNSCSSDDGGGGGMVGPVTWRRQNDNDSTTTANADVTGKTSTITVGSEEINPTVCHPVQLRKWLFSATLTQDPQKLASLGLINPKRYDAHHLLLRPSSSSSNNGEVGGEIVTPPIMGGGAGYYSLPEGLSEFQIECRTAEQKLPVLLALLLDREERARSRALRRRRQQHQQHSNNLEEEDVDMGVVDRKDDDDDDDGIAVVFTSSIDSTHRLTRLLQLLWCGRRRQQQQSGSAIGQAADDNGGGCGLASSICEFSSALTQDQRFELVRRCRRDNDNEPSSPNDDAPIRIVVCSDGMSRGMDLPSVTTVINYDVPSHAKTYVHRCGRTARAGRKGRAITILKVGQVGMFEKMHRLVEGVGSTNGCVREMGVRREMVDVVLPLYKRCVVVLKKVMEMEEDGDVCSMAPLDEEEWGLELSAGDNQT